MSPLPPVALSCGDPSGIGPEIAVKARAILGAGLPFFWIGDPRHLPAGAAFATITEPGEAGSLPAGVLPVLAQAFPHPAVPGRPDPANALAIVSSIEHAVALVQAGRAAAVTTAPIHKKGLKEGAGFAFPGHTEFLAHLAGDMPVAMMLACKGLRVVPATIHIPLAQVPGALTGAVLERAIRITRAALARDFAIPDPVIAVSGLNPHAGEGGTMGSEEERMIRPLLTRLATEGMRLLGPLPADTMFHPRARAGYDAAVCAYHDQALIPVKTIDFAGTVNITLGLPFVRTSPDHGTAHDIAGRGVADPSSLVAALVMARDMAVARASAA